MRQRLVIVTFALFFQVMTSGPLQAGSLEDVSQLSNYKIRAGFIGLNDIKLLSEMKANGLNTAMVVFGSMNYPMTDFQKNLLTKWAYACHSEGLKFMPIINLWGRDEKNWFIPKYHYFTNGTEFNNTPCPTDPVFYDKVIHKRFEEIALLSHTVPISAVILDIEMYGADYIGYPPEFCFCDYCFSNYQKSVSDTSNIAPYNRESYLKKTGQTKAYEEFQVNQIAKMAERTRLRLEEIVKDFSIGILQMDKLSPHNKGLAIGFAKGKNPVLAFSEHTYSTGYSPYISKTIERLKSEGLNFIFIPGIWQDKFHVENLPFQYYHCARISGGYWIYQLVTLNSEYYKEPLNAPREKFWSAIRLANIELDKLSKDTNYESHLKNLPLKASLPAIDFGSIRIERIEYVTPGAELEREAEPLSFHSFNKLVFPANKGDVLRFGFVFNKRPDSKVDYAQVFLVTNTGKILCSDDGTLDKNAVVEAVAPYTGSYGLMLNPERNILKANRFTHPFSIDAGELPRTHLIRPSAPIYFWRPPNSEPPKIHLWVDGVREGVIATFSTETGENISQYEIKSKKVVTLPLAKNKKGQIIVLKIKPLPGAYFEDVFVTVVSGLGKYISQYKSGLVKIKDSYGIK